MPGDSGVLVVTRVPSTATTCTRDRGCSGHPAFPTPSKGGETFHQRLGRICAAGSRRMSANQLTQSGTGWWTAADRAYVLSSSALPLEMRPFEPAGCRLQQI